MAVRTITTKLALDETEFKRELQQVNSGLRNLKSEMALVSEEFKGQSNTVAALTEKDRILRQQHEQQTEKVNALRRAVDEAAKAYGDADKRTDDYRRQLNYAQTDLLKLDRELQDNSRYLDEAKESADGTAHSIDEWGKEVKNAGGNVEKLDKEVEKVDKSSDKLGEVLKSSAEAVAAFSAAAAAAAIAFGKNAVNAYADYEQLAGGVETLFGDNSSDVMVFAENAFKTAGVSANKYMEIVTGFSASLISSLDGDTEKAAQTANKAITDMSDNANKMGTDIGSIQNAYQGFAKKQYAMLDNLKLGYGGTQTEMQRLLEDAEKFSGIKYNIDSYSDVIDAIHVIQTEIGITGTTEKEAENTISGSIGMLQSAIEDFMAGIGGADSDVEILTKNAIDSFSAVLKNVEPVLNNIVDALPNALKASIDALHNMLPSIVKTVGELFSVALESFLKMLPELSPAAANAVITVAEGLLDNLDLIIDAAFAIVEAVISGISDALPKLAKKIPEIIKTIVKTLAENFPELYRTAGEMIAELIHGLLESIPDLAASIPEIVAAIISGFVNTLPQIFEVGVEIVSALWEGISGQASWLYEKISEWLSGIVESIKGNSPPNTPAAISSKTVSFAADEESYGMSNSYLDDIKSGKKNGSHAGGLDYVPFDGYVAELHRGEAVLRADEAAGVRAAKAYLSAMGGAAQNAAQGTTGGVKVIELHTTMQMDKRTLGEAVTEYQLGEERKRG